MPKAVTLVDNFGDNQTDTARWSAFGPVMEVNQRLEIRPPSSGSNVYGGYVSAGSYDLTGSQITVELVRALRSNLDGAETYLHVKNSAGDHLFFKVQDALFYCTKLAASSTSSTHLAEAPYDPARHRWMRIREQLGTLYFEYSADGCRFELFVGIPTPWSLTSVVVELAAGTYNPGASPGVAIFDNVNYPETSLARRVEERRLSARDVRVEAAELMAERRHDEHHNNNDEVNYPTRPLIGNFSKSLKHDAVGDPDPASYATLLRALESRDPADFEEIQLASATAVKLTNPQTGLTFDLEGPDPQEITQPPAPRFDSRVAANEAGELYWMAVARDIPFISYPSDSTINTALTSLSGEFPEFGGTTPVTPQNIFRGIYPGEQVGPYVSQFLLKGNVDPRKLPGLGRDAADGYVSYGAKIIDQRVVPQKPGVDYLTVFSDWLAVQNGTDKRGNDQFGPSRVFIHTLRDGATLVHFDQVLNAWYDTAWILMTEPMGNQSTAAAATGRPQIDLEFPKDQGNPYDPPGTAMDSKTQVGFNTFGPTHLLQVLGEVLGRALRAVWYQKWFVHRRLRPEEYGGRVDNHITGRRQYLDGTTPLIHASILQSLQTGLLSSYYGGQPGDKFPSYLLPQAFPEGAPTHPAYGAGHATGSGAMATILKAFFDESTPIENPVQADATGATLVAYTGPDATQMTLGGELNKLAGNIAIFRNAAGVHWRTDYTESLLLGEAVAIGLLQEQSLGFNEDDAYFQLTKFDGTTIRIFDGKVVRAL
jgi:hypothetical protein